MAEVVSTAVIMWDDVSPHSRRTVAIVRQDAAAMWRDCVRFDWLFNGDSASGRYVLDGPASV